MNKQMNLTGHIMQFKVGDLIIIKECDKLFNSGVIIKIFEGIVFIQFQKGELVMPCSGHILEEYVTKDGPIGRFKWIHHAAN